jgi:dipeptidyl aminopeptidase/acylaminoacyl peptidase
VKSWTVKDILSFGVPVDLAAAPNGQNVVYSLRTLNEDKGEYEYKLWHKALVERTNLSEPQQLTQGEGRDTRPIYHPAGNGIGFLSTREQAGEEKEDENEHVERLWFLPLTGGEAFCVSKSLGSVYDFAFHPNGRFVYVIVDAGRTDFEQEADKKREERKQDYTHEERNVKAKRICEIELKNGNMKTIYKRDFGLIELTVAPNGKEIAFVTNGTGLANDWEKANIWLLKKSDCDSSDSWQKTPVIIREGACRMPRFSPNGHHIAFIAPRYAHSEHGQSEIWVVEKDAKTDPVNLTESAMFVGDVQSIDWVNDNQIVAQVEKGLYSPMIRICGLNSPTVEFVTDKSEVVSEFSLAKESGQILYLAETADEPANIYHFRTDGSEGYQATNLHESQKDLPRARTEVFKWASFDGKEMEGLFVTPTDAKDEPFPLIVDIHGGPAWHTRKNFSHYLNYHWLASLGYAVFSPNYRGGIGYGQDYIFANNRDLGGGDYKDILSGVDALVAAGKVDSSRMGVTGGSYGGYMTNWIIGHDSRFKAAVSEFGIWSLFTDFGCSSQRCWEVMYLGRYWENESLYLERSPSRYVNHVTTPVLIIHGDDDDNTFPSNSREMYNALVEAGKTVEFVHYPREGHGIREPRHRLDELTKISEWFIHFIPTSKANLPVPFGVTNRYKNTETEMMVNKAEVVSNHNPEDSEMLISVDLSIYPELQENPPGSSAAAKEVFSLHTGSVESNNIFLAWYGNEAYQRPSVIGKFRVAPVGILYPGTGITVGGQLDINIFEAVHLKFLFPANLLDAAKLEDLVLEIDDHKFSLHD